jgi:WD40 repeat protein
LNSILLVYRGGSEQLMGKPGHYRWQYVNNKRCARRGFTLFGLMLAVSFCCLVLAFLVTMRESVNPRHMLDREELSADGSKLAVFFLDGHADVFDAASGAILSTFRPDGAGDQWQPFALPAFSADGRRIVVVGFDEERQESIIQVWDAPDDRVLKRFAVNGIVRSVAISPDGSQVAFIPQSAVGVSILDVATSGVTTHAPPNIGAWRDTPRICYSPDGRQLALAGRQFGNAVVAVMDMASGATSVLPAMPAARNSAIAFSPDGRQLCVRSDPGNGTPKLYILDGVGFSRARSLDIAFENNFGIAFSPDSKCVIERQAAPNALRPERGDPNVFDLETLAPTDKWRVPFDYRAVASAAPLAVTMQDRQFVLYNTSTGEPTGIEITYGVGQGPLLIILALFFVWVICLAVHRNQGAPKILCPICGRSMPAAKQAKSICQICQTSFLSVQESQRRIRKAWAVLFGALLVVIGGGFIYSWRITLLFSAVLALSFGWIFLRQRQKQNLVKYLDAPAHPTTDLSPPADTGMRHWSIDSSGAVQAVGPAAPSANAEAAREDEIVRRSVARARAAFARLLGRDFDFSPGVNITSFAEFEKLRDLLLKIGIGRARVSNIYALRPMRRVLFCEAEVRNQLFDLDTAICNSLSYVLFDNKTARRAPAWLQMGVTHLVAFGADADESDGLNRAVRACLAEDSLIEPAMLRLRLKQLLPYWRQSNNYEAYKFLNQLGAFAASLVEYLTTVAPADVQTGFVSLFRAAHQGAAPAELIERHLHRSEEQLLTEWRAWVERRVCPAPTPTADIQDAIVHEVAPTVINPQAVYLDRLRAIRTLGERGYLLGVDSLRTVVENVNDEPELKRAAVYSLKMIESVDGT